jgi:hypothetical protein
MHDELRANRVRCLMAEWRRVVADRPEISQADELDRRQRERERKAECEQREEQEAAAVRQWLERRQFEDNYRQSEPVAAAGAEAGDWSAWNRWADSRVERYIEARVEELVERRVAERVQGVYAEMRELATSIRKAISAMAKAIEKHDELIRQQLKRDETDVRSDNPRSLRVVN